MLSFSSKNKKLHKGKYKSFKTDYRLSMFVPNGLYRVVYPLCQLNNAKNSLKQIQTYSLKQALYIA